jgi:hypothetical protein
MANFSVNNRFWDYTSTAGIGGALLYGTPSTAVNAPVNSS